MPENTAKLTFFGVRGSTPSIDRMTWRYGGNTPSIELVTPSGGRFVLDCGTGLRMLGNRWGAIAGQRSIEADIFLSHYHWDHVQGIPFFVPFYSAQNRFRLYGFRSEFVGPRSLERVFEAQMANPYFPVNLSSMSAEREFIEITGGDRFTVGDTRVTSRWLNHPQGCLGLRFETPAGTIVYATDNEPGAPEFDRALLDLADQADIFINDAQYTPGQLLTRNGWGHSTWLAGVRAAQTAGVRNLVLYHHDPDSSDKAVDDILRDARAQFDNVWAATEEMKITLGSGTIGIELPAERDSLAGELQFRARVSGCDENGRNFDEGTSVRGASLRRALLDLGRAPKLQSELRIHADSVEHLGSIRGNQAGVLRAQVVSVKPAPEKERVDVEIEFTE